MDVDRLRPVVVRAYRTMAYVTGTMLIILCFVGIPLQFLAHYDAVEKVVGTLHGVLYLIYLVVAFTMTRFVRIKTASVTTIIVLLAGTIPVLTFVVERWISRRYIDPALASSPQASTTQAAVSQ